MACDKTFVEISKLRTPIDGVNGDAQNVYPLTPAHVCQEKILVQMVAKHLEKHRDIFPMAGCIKALQSLDGRWGVCIYDPFIGMSPDNGQWFFLTVTDKADVEIGGTDHPQPFGWEQGPLGMVSYNEELSLAWVSGTYVMEQLDKDSPPELMFKADYVVVHADCAGQVAENIVQAERDQEAVAVWESGEGAWAYSGNRW